MRLLYANMLLFFFNIITIPLFDCLVAPFNLNAQFYDQAANTLLAATKCLQLDHKLCIQITKQPN